MPDQHAVLSPSASKRWISCPASIRMQTLVTQPVQSSSRYAEEGTTAHTVAELSARCLVLEQLTVESFTQAALDAMEGLPEDVQQDMLRHGEAYADLLLEKLREHPMSRLLLEQRLPTGVPQCWGTSDAVIVSPEHVEIVDYKYGLGIWVGAEENSQLMLYGVGALDTYGDVLGETQNVRLTIHQPRLDNVSSWDIAPDKLRAWRDGVVKIAEQALNDDNAPFGPSAEACRYCPAAGECRPRMEAATSEDFASEPDLLEAEEIGDLLKRIPEIKAWCSAVEDTALRKAYSDGVTIPGWKVVMSGGRRSIPDQEAALAALYAAGWTAEQVATKKLRGIGELERLLGKDEFKTVLSSLAVKGSGSPSLAPESDKRPAVSPNNEAVKEFQE